MKNIAHGILGTADYIVLVGYFVLMLVIGIYFYRYMKGMKDYFSGGNRLPWWLSGASYYMSSFSVFAFVSFSAITYKYGLYGVTLMLDMTVGVVFSMFFMAEKWKGARINNPIEYLETLIGQMEEDVTTKEESGTMLICLLFSCCFCFHNFYRCALIKYSFLYPHWNGFLRKFDFGIITYSYRNNRVY